MLRFQAEDDSSDDEEVMRVVATGLMMTRSVKRARVSEPEIPAQVNEPDASEGSFYCIDLTQDQPDATEASLNSDHDML